MTRALKHVILDSAVVGRQLHFGPSTGIMKDPSVYYFSIMVAEEIRIDLIRLKSVKRFADLNLKIHHQQSE